MRKEQVLEAIKEFPQDFELDSLIERLIFIEKIEEGIKAADEGRTMSHEEVVRKSKEWRK